MQYRSIADLNRTVLNGLRRIPSDVDLIVGIPRSGLLPANMISLMLNLPLADLDGFCAGRILSTGKTRRSAPNTDASAYRKVLVVDDSISSGEAMKEARRRIAEVDDNPDRFLFCAVYGVEEESPVGDIIFERVSNPRIFEWNLMHHPILVRSCVDIDGVLCLDPTDQENDDGPLYSLFLGNARPLYTPGFRIGHLVTSRLEKYRAETERWLRDRGIEYDKLWMLDLPSAEERRRQGAHGTFKARVYSQVGADLFIESEDGQAVEIARISGKPVLSIETQSLVYPDNLLSHTARKYRRAMRRAEAQSFNPSRWKDSVKRMLRRVLPQRQFDKLVKWRQDKWRQRRIAMKS